MLKEKTKKSNIAAGIWFISMFALIGVALGGSEGSNIWEDGNYLAIAIFFVHAGSLFVALWFYAEAKGYSGFVGVGLAFLYVIGLLILLALRDKHKDSNGDTVVPELPPPPIDGPYILRLFNGDVPLVITYWIWGGLVGAVLVGIVTFIEEIYYAPIATNPSGAILLQWLYWFLLAYVIFIWIAIWRSAGKYRGGVWGSVARGMVVLGALSTIGTFVTEFNKDAEVTLAEEVRMMNASLPMMVDETTRLDSVRHHAGKLTYSNTLVNTPINEIDVDYFHETAKRNLSGSLCNEEAIRLVLRNGMTYAYSYEDMNGISVTEISITEDDCK